MSDLHQIIQETNPNQEIIDKVDELNNLTWDNMTNPKQIQDNAKEAFKLAKEAKYEIGIAYSKLSLAIADFHINSNILFAMRDVYAAMDTFKKNNESRGQRRACTLLSFLYLNMGNYDTAFEWVMKGMKIKENIGPREFAWSYYVLGKLYELLKDFEQAKTNLISALKYFSNTNTFTGAITTNITLGSVLAQMGDYEGALIKSMSSLKQAEKLGLRFSRSNALFEIGKVYMLMGNTKKAIDNHLEALLLREEIKNKQSIIMSQYALAEIHHKIKDYESTLGFLNIAQLNARYINSTPYLIKILKLKAEIEKRKGNYKESLALYEEYMMLKSEMLGEENNLQLKNIQASHKVEIAQQETNNQIAINKKLSEAHQKIASQQKKILYSIQYAQRIQKTILPEQAEMKKYLSDIFVIYKPKDIVSGDFYWFQHRENKSIIASIDCTGHGVPGALMSVIADSAMNKAVLEKGIYMPEQILKQIHQEINLLLKQEATQNRDGMDMTICTIDHDKNTLYFSGAHNPLLYSKEGVINEIKGERCSIGGYTKKVQHYKRHTINLNGGETFYMFSDGFQDQFGGEKNQKFMKRRFKELLLSSSLLTFEEQENYLNTTFQNWKGQQKQTDDILVMGFRV